MATTIRVTKNLPALSQYLLARHVELTPTLLVPFSQTPRQSQLPPGRDHLNGDVSQG